MFRVFIFMGLFLVGCGSQKNYYLHDVTVCDTITFPPIHTHDWNNNKWVCNEFPADTLEIDNILTIK